MNISTFKIFIIVLLFSSCSKNNNDITVEPPIAPTPPIPPVEEHFYAPLKDILPDSVGVKIQSISYLTEYNSFDGTTVEKDNILCAIGQKDKKLWFAIFEATIENNKIKATKCTNQWINGKEQETQEIINLESGEKVTITHTFNNLYHVYKNGDKYCFIFFIDQYNDYFTAESTLKEYMSCSPIRKTVIISDKIYEYKELSIARPWYNSYCISNLSPNETIPPFGQHEYTYNHYYSISDEKIYDWIYNFSYDIPINEYLGFDGDDFTCYNFKTQRIEWSSGSSIKNIVLQSVPDNAKLVYTKTSAKDNIWTFSVEITYFSGEKEVRTFNLDINDGSVTLNN